MASDHRDADLNLVTVYTLRLLRGVRDLPADLAAVAAFVLLTDFVVLAPLIRDTPVRIVVGLPFVLFVPGYAFIAALFPEAGEPPSESAETDSEAGLTERVGDRGIDGIERVALSFGLSIAVVPLIGLVLNFTPWGIRLIPILVSVSGFVLITTAIAVLRRWELPTDERFEVPYRQWTASARTELFEPDDRADAALNILLVISVVAAVSSVGYAVAVPQQGEQFTEFYLLTEDDDGELVADGYPTEFTRGGSQELIVGVTNQEHRRTNYTLLVQTHRVRTDDNTTTITESESLRRFDLSLAHNETDHRAHSVAPTLEGRDLRLTYLLYKSEPPARTTPETAYRETHLWVNVTS
ncbi:DUF1616 domain-containing protein [Halosimplex rubrum]|uniref:DUF1616 domain-containing protein n=1 Tax=Halosimplex rubrum TaxID=869889 RepID=UPI0037446E89